MMDHKIDVKDKVSFRLELNIRSIRFQFYRPTYKVQSWNSYDDISDFFLLGITHEDVASVFQKAVRMNVAKTLKEKYKLLHSQ